MCRYDFTTKVNTQSNLVFFVYVILSGFSSHFHGKQKSLSKIPKEREKNHSQKLSENNTYVAELSLFNQKLTFVPFQLLIVNPPQHQALFDTSWWCSVLTFVRDFSHVPYSYLFCAVVILPQVFHIRLCRVQYYGCWHK